jgi:SAM-dependent methyltransferase
MSLRPASFPKRGKYQGLLQILSYNRHFYAMGAAAIILSLTLLARIPAGFHWILLTSISVVLFWMVSSLLVSHYVYDRSSVHDVSWALPILAGRKPEKWIQLHAGLDESSTSLFTLFPGSDGHVVDMYDPKEMTEPSIAQARTTANKGAAEGVNWRALPFPDHVYDAAFLIFAAHELRQRSARCHLFGQLKRVIKPGGKVLMAEHLRDSANFLAFGPGAFHFFSRGEWLYAAQQAGLKLAMESSITPFVHVFVFEPAP